MSGLEVLGAVASAAGLVEIIFEVRKHCRKTAEKLETIEQAKISGIQQIDSLRIVIRTLVSSFDSYNTDVIHSLSQKARQDIEKIVKETNHEIEKCEGIAFKLRALTTKKRHSPSELKRLGQDLDRAINVIQFLHNAFSLQIHLETHRRVSQGNAEHEARGLGNHNPSTRRDSDLESIAPARRQDTLDSSWSSRTLTQPLSPFPTHTSGSSSGSTSSSTNSHCIKVVESRQLQNAVNDEDIQQVEQLIRQHPTEVDQEVWTVSALFLACRSRRKSLVENLLHSHPNASIIDEDGLSIMHATIGDSEQLCEIKEQASADILKLLVDYQSSLIRSIDKEKRQPLHYCAMTGNYRAAQYILHEDSKRINATDSRKKTPLYHICEHHSPNKRLVKLFLHYGGNFGTRSRPMMNHAKLKGIKKILDDEGKKRALTLPS